MGVVSSRVVPQATNAIVEECYEWSADLKSRIFARVQCAYEGGRQCQHENPAAQQGDPSPFALLHSNWVDERMLAMARPWEESLRAEDSQLLRQMHDAGIRLVLNVQEFGEHARCGPGLSEGSGFSYRPETFMQYGIRYSNMAWQDMTTPSLRRMMDICHIIDGTAESGGKIAVHCHAGLGRTGLVIACYLVYRDGLSPSEALSLVRLKRKGAVQTPRQESFIRVFAVFLRHLRAVIPAAPQSDNQKGESDTAPLLKAASGTPVSGREMSGGRAGGDAPTDPAAPSRAVSVSAPAGPALPWDDKLRLRNVYNIAAYEAEPGPPPPTTLEEAMRRQRLMLNGEDLRRHWGTPRLIGRCLAALPGAVGRTGAGAMSDALRAEPGSCGASIPTNIIAAVNSGPGTYDPRLPTLTPEVLLGLIERTLADWDSPPLAPETTAQLEAAIDQAFAAARLASPINPAGTLNEEAVLSKSELRAALTSATEAFVSRAPQQERSLVACIVRHLRAASDAIARPSILSAAVALDNGSQDEGHGGGAAPPPPPAPLPDWELDPASAAALVMQLSEWLAGVLTGRRTSLHASLEGTDATRPRVFELPASVLESAARELSAGTPSARTSAVLSSQDPADSSHTASPAALSAWGLVLFLSSCHEAHFAAVRKKKDQVGYQQPKLQRKVSRGHSQKAGSTGHGGLKPGLGT